MAELLINQAADPRELERAWLRVFRNDLEDGVISKAGRRFLGDLDANLERLSDQLLRGSFQWQPPVEFSLPKASGGTRTLRVPSVRDRIVLARLADLVDPWADLVQSPFSYAYRQGSGVSRAVNEVVKLRDQGLHWAAGADITDCFGTLDRSAAFLLLEQLIPDDSLGWLFHTLDSQTRKILETDGRGVLQGSPLSPVLCNLALTELDNEFFRAGLVVHRYADDMLIQARSEREARAALETLTRLVEEAGMTVSPEKTRIMSSKEGFTFLGEEFAGDHPAVQEEVRPNERRALYVGGTGRGLVLESGKILVNQKKEELLAVPQKRVERIVTLGPVGISAGVRQWALNAGVPLIHLSLRGKFLGSSVSFDADGLDRRRRQYRLCEDALWQMPMAASMVVGKIAGQRSLMIRYGADLDDHIVRRCVNTLAEAQVEAMSVETVDELMGIEGYASKSYWEAFGRLLPEEIKFPGRRRRPPPDAVNSALSLGYSVLTTEAVGAIAAAGLDPACGVLHAPQQGRASLALDLVEEFRPLIVDSMVLDAFRRRILTHESVRPNPEPEKGGVLLTDEGRKAFFARYERRMATVFGHAVLRSKMSYRYAVHAQAQAIARMVETGMPAYEPVRWR